MACRCGTATGCGPASLETAGLASSGVAETAASRRPWPSTPGDRAPAFTAGRTAAGRGTAGIARLAGVAGSGLPSLRGFVPAGNFSGREASMVAADAFCRPALSPPGNALTRRASTAPNAVAGPGRVSAAAAGRALAVVAVIASGTAISRDHQVQLRCQPRRFTGIYRVVQVALRSRFVAYCRSTRRARDRRERFLGSRCPAR